jgi:hypothetical protein
VVSGRVGPRELAEAALAGSALLHSLRWAGVSCAIPAPPEVALAAVALRSWADDLSGLAGDESAEHRPPA